MWDAAKSNTVSAVGPKARLAREFADRAAVFAKIGLILRHWERLAAANPASSHWPARRGERAPV